MGLGIGAQRERRAVTGIGIGGALRGLGIGGVAMGDFFGRVLFASRLKGKLQNKQHRAVGYSFAPVGVCCSCCGGYRLLAMASHRRPPQKLPPPSLTQQSHGNRQFTAALFRTCPTASQSKAT